MTDVCAMADCPQPRYSRGYCQYHYDSLRRGGLLSPIQVRMPTDGPCLFDGCTEQIYAKGMCNAHYQQSRRGIELRPVNDHLIREGAVCVGPSCDRPQYCRDLCVTHYNQERAGKAMTLLPRPRRKPDGSCVAEGCRRTAEDPGRGDLLCLSHGIIQRRGAVLLPLVERTPTERIGELVARGVYWCTVCQQELPLARFHKDSQREGVPKSRCRSCLGKLTRAKNFNLSFADVDRLFAYQDHRCALCHEAYDDGDGLNLDHDHDHCPAKGQGCRICVRGLLCWNCNAGVITWYERLRGTMPAYQPIEDYLNNPPASRLNMAARSAG